MVQNLHNNILNQQEFFGEYNDFYAQIVLLQLQAVCFVLFPL